MFSWLRRSRNDDTGAPRWAPPVSVPPSTQWRAAAAALGDGEPIGEALASALAVEIEARAGAVVAGWPAPRLSDLRVRLSGVPDWWSPRGNLLLAGPGSTIPEVISSTHGPPHDALVAIGSVAHLRQVIVGGASSVVAVGDATRMAYADIEANDGLVAIGAGTSATFYAQIDARNGGAALIGEDGMWGHGARLMTDDMHTIRDLATGRRINPRGGRIAIARHVWLGEQVIVSGESRIGADTVIGAGSFVRGRALPANSICTGRPVRVTRTGTSWAREDVA